MYKVKNILFSIAIIVLAILLYIAINVPNLQKFPGSISLYLLPVAYLYIFSKCKVILYLNFFKNEIFILSILSFYCLVLDNVSGQDIYFVNCLYYLVDILPISFFLVLLFNNIYTDKVLRFDNFINLIIFVSAISGLISILLFTYPDFNDYIRSNILRTDDKSFDYSYRSFGLASGLFFSYPIMQGLISALCLLYSKNRPYLLIAFIFIFPSVFFNARTGFIPIILCLLFFMVYFRVYKTTFLLFLLLLSFVLFGLFMSGLLIDMEYTIEWAMAALYAVSNVLFGTKYMEASSTFDILNNMILFPNNVFFGDQKYYFGALVNASDIGYILQINYGGIILLVAIFIFWFCVFKQIYKLSKSRIECRAFCVILVVTFILANYKGDLMVPSCIQRFTILYYVWMKFYYTKIANHNVIVA